MPRQMLTDEHWSKLRPILLHQGIYAKVGLRTTVEGILYRMRTGCQWRDLPEALGPWNTVYKRFNAWSASGKLIRIFSALVEDPDVEWLFIDGSYVKAHQDSTGVCTEAAEAIGRSRAGNTSKIHLAVNAYGLPNSFRITGGEVHDSTEAQAFINDLPTGEALVADKGYDSECIRKQVEAKSLEAVIPRRRYSKKENAGLDRGLYRYRHMVENAFARLKPYRAIASRYDKLKRITKAWWPWPAAFYGYQCKTSTRPRQPLTVYGLGHQTLDQCELRFAKVVGQHRSQKRNCPTRTLPK